MDNDVVDETNLNRQLIATYKTIGKDKVVVCKERILEINPNAEVQIFKEFFMPESEDVFNDKVSYVIDCVDTVAAKLEIIVRANKFKVPVISCMGTGNKLDATAFEVTDIYKTSDCPLAKVMRKELRKKGIDKLKVVFSREKPVNRYVESEKLKKHVPGSISFVPSVAGLIIAGEVVKDILEYNN